MNIKEELKDFAESFKEVYTQFWKPLITGFWKVAPSQTFALAALTGFNLSIFFRDLGYALAVFLSFLVSIFLFVKLYQKSRDRLIQEEKERIEQLCQTVDRYARRDNNE
ncbi:hypothetical protein [Thermodesulfovibrio yellowstonii]|uniref:hypothetical protein n=1 Tax=Thermodesulfovibrio yellowstonii TaxID=28262 RepID=UPI0024B375A8|nr:hypothetical protein [Thermodesulfovibrio yellowstonii]MDI6864626.1 hypothetical protein [Thermodesulfovibrio yellowstonii]